MKEILKYLRTVNGYSQEKVAEAIGLSRQSYNKYEAGTVVPSDRTVASLAAFYHVDEAFIKANKVPAVPGQKTPLYSDVTDKLLEVDEAEPAYAADAASEKPVLPVPPRKVRARTYDAYFSHDAIHVIGGNSPYPYEEGQRLKVIVEEETPEEEQARKDAAWKAIQEILEKRPFTYEGKDPDYDQMRYEAMKEKYGPF
ncbi:MAG: helix-turn-helix transcriptional regulator [Treponema sp.]|nr:helix-turn-helix transcriptional regulator [Candidatus Treponema caballi]